MYATESRLIEGVSSPKRHAALPNKPAGIPYANPSFQFCSNIETCTLSLSHLVRLKPSQLIPVVNMRAFALVSVFTSVSGAASLSFGNIERDVATNGKQCNAIRNLVSYAGTAAQSTATAFCSSYLGIKTSTVLTTTTSISTATSIIVSTTGTATFTASAITATSFAFVPLSLRLHHRARWLMEAQYNHGDRSNVRLSLRNLS